MSSILKVFCNGCSRETSHDVLNVVRQNIEDAEDPSYPESYIYKTIQCRGCDGVQLYEIWDYPGGGDVTQYPPPMYRRSPKWLWQLSDFASPGGGYFYSVIREIYVGLQNNQPHLVAMGVRAVLEHVMIDNVGDNGNFVKNLDKFYEKNHISKHQYEGLQTALNIGHAAIHRGHTPTHDQLVFVVDILEQLIQGIYVNSRQGKSAAEGIPERTKAQKT
ncbi:DUF4145 domain-containing protein [Burkholderia orbicola]